MPIVTQSRTLPPVPAIFYHRSNGKVVQTGAMDLPRDSQTTTSFRSGPQYEKSSGDAVVDAAVGKTGLSARRSVQTVLRAEVQGRYDQGHEFSTSRTTYHSEPTWTLRTVNGGVAYTYDGVIRPSLTVHSVVPVLTGITSAEQSALGRDLISKTIPTAPEANLATMLGELRERLPSLIGLQTYRRGLGSQTSGSEYLNVEFGLLPLGRDIGLLAAGVVNAAKAARQMQRDSGRVVRRRRSLQPVVETQELAPFAANPSIGGGGNVTRTLGFHATSYGPVLTTDVKRRVVKFSGAYSYYLEESQQFLDRLQAYEQMANHLLGSRITPEVVWNLTPWSWLFDWFSDAGTFMTNVSALSKDSLVLRYGYLMVDESITRTRTQRVTPRVGGDFWTRTEISVRQKTRKKATPYGFDVSLEALSPRQWAILGALGMSRSPGSMR